MKMILFVAVLCVGGLFAVQVNDLAPDFDNTISDDGFWDTTGHPYVEVTIAESDISEYDSIDSILSYKSDGLIAIFDSRENTSDESDTLLRFTSRPMGTIINVR